MLLHAADGRCGAVQISRERPKPPYVLGSAQPVRPIAAPDYHNAAFFVIDPNIAAMQETVEIQPDAEAEAVLAGIRAGLGGEASTDPVAQKALANLRATLSSNCKLLSDELYTKKVNSISSSIPACKHPLLQPCSEHACSEPAAPLPPCPAVPHTSGLAACA